MKTIEEQIPFMQQRYSEYWESEEHDIDLASWLVDCVPQLIIHIHQLRGALGYPVPGSIRENNNITNGIADALGRQLEELRQENERLQERIEMIERAGYV